MIEARADPGALAAQLTTRAEQLARARTVMLLRRRDERRWRNAGLLWPLFGQE